MSHEQVFDLDNVWKAAKGPDEQNLWLKGQAAEIINDPMGGGRRFTSRLERYGGRTLALESYPGRRDMYFEVMEVTFYQGSIAKLEVHTVADAGEKALKIVDYTNGKKRVIGKRGTDNMSPVLIQELLTEGRFVAFTDAPEAINVEQTVNQFLQQIQNLDFSTPHLV